MKHTVEDRADRLMRLHHGSGYSRDTLIWASYRLQVAFADASRAVGLRYLHRRHWLLPYLAVAWAILVFDALVEVTARLLEAIR